MTIPLIPDIDGDCTAHLRQALREAAGGELELDLRLVPYLSSGALTELARYRRRFGTICVLTHPNPLVLRTLHVVGFNKLFAIEGDAA